MSIKCKRLHYVDKVDDDQYMCTICNAKYDLSECMVLIDEYGGDPIGRLLGYE